MWKTFTVDWSVTFDRCCQFAHIKKRKAKTEPRQQFVGKWQFTSKMKDTVSIEITEEHSLTIDGKHSPTVIVELTPSRLVLLDSLGYHLIIEQRTSASPFMMKQKIGNILWQRSNDFFKVSSLFILDFLWKCSDFLPAFLDSSCYDSNKKWLNKVFRWVIDDRS